MARKRQPQQRLQELGDFLRTRRARIAPEDVGLARGSRRRSPGLNRTEVAQLANVNIDWYTWLEQGRPIRTSTQVLERLAQVLHLEAEERKHLFLLAHQQPPPETVIRLESVSPALWRYLDSLSSSPAVVVGKHWDFLAWNRAACMVFISDFRKMSVTPHRNMIWRIFTWTPYRRMILNWEEHSQRMLAQFRASCAHYPDDPTLTALIQDLLHHSLEFRAWWPDHNVIGALEGRKVVNHPLVGTLVFEHIDFHTIDTPELRVIAYTPLREADTLAKLSRLLNESGNVYDFWNVEDYEELLCLLREQSNGSGASVPYEQLTSEQVSAETRNFQLANRTQRWSQTESENIRPSRAVKGAGIPLGQASMDSVELNTDTCLSELLQSQQSEMMKKLLILADPLRQNHEDPAAYLETLVERDQKFQAGIAKRNANVDYRSLTLDELNSYKTEGAAQERYRRTAKAIMAYNASVEEPLKRWFVNANTIRDVSKGRYPAIKAWVDANQATLEAHHAAFDINQKYNRKPYLINEVITLSPDPDPEVPAPSEA